MKSVVTLVDVVAVLAAEVITLGVGALLGELVGPGSAAVKDIVPLLALWLPISLISFASLRWVGVP